MQRLLLSILILLAACSEGATVTRGDADAPGPAEVDATPDATDTADAPDKSDEGDEGPAPDDTDVVADTADTTPPARPDVFGSPQPDACTDVWSRRLEGGELLAMRSIASQTYPRLLLLVEAAGPASLVDGDTPAPLAGDGRRVVMATVDAATGKLSEAFVEELAEGEHVAGVTKAGAGFAFGVVSDTRPDGAGRIVLAQQLGSVLRVARLSLEAEGGDFGLPTATDLHLASAGGASTALALRLSAPLGGTLHVVVGEVSLALPVDPIAAGVGLLTLPAGEGANAPSEGFGLVSIPSVEAERVTESTLGPVVEVVALAPTTIRGRELAEGDRALVIAALPEAVASLEPEELGDPSVPVALWVGAGLETLQLASSGQGAIVLAGRAPTGGGELSFGDETRVLAPAQGFVASLGAGGSFLYEAAECDHLHTVSAGGSVRILKRGCDVDGQGPGLALTVLGGGFEGDSEEPVDLLMVPLPEGVEPTVLSGLASFSVSNGRAYGAVVDFGGGPRIVAVRGDGQLYDSGVLDRLVDGATGPLRAWLSLRQGGGGGGGSTNNAFAYAVPTADGALIGRARVDFETWIR